MIVIGDNGITIPFVAAKSAALDLTGATVDVSINRNGDLIPKTATIIDAANGKCEFTLLNEDLTVEGFYLYQWTAKFSDGRILNGVTKDFYVSEKLAGSPVTIIVDGGVF